MEQPNTSDRKSRKRRDVFYEFKLPVSREYDEFVLDLLRVLVIQATMFLMYFTSNAPVDFGNYVVLQLFMLIGVSVYWLIVRKFVKFSYT